MNCLVLLWGNISKFHLRCCGRVSVVTVSTAPLFFGYSARKKNEGDLGSWQGLVDGRRAVRHWSVPYHRSTQQWKSLIAISFMRNTFWFPWIILSLYEKAFYLPYSYLSCLRVLLETIKAESWPKIRPKSCARFIPRHESPNGYVPTDRFTKTDLLHLYCHIVQDFTYRIHWQ